MRNATSEAAPNAAYLRRLIARSSYTPTQRSILNAMLGLWFRHGFEPVHPGREALAKKARVCVKTISRQLAILVRQGVLVVHAFGKGGVHRATQYRINVVRLQEMCGASHALEIVPPEVIHRGAEFGKNVPQIAGQVSRKSLAKNTPKVRDKMSHWISCISMHTRSASGIERQEEPTIARAKREELAFYAFMVKVLEGVEHD